jgi:hypothetical protein
MVDPKILRNNPDQAAEQIAQAIRASGGSLQPVYESIEAALARVERSGMPPEALLPAEARLGFLGRQKKDGASFLTAYSDVIGENLCKPGCKLRIAVESGLTASGAGLVTSILGALAVPPVAIGIAAAIGGAILALGVDAFCRATVPADGPT